MKPNRKPIRKFRIDPNAWVLIRQILIGLSVFLTLGLLITAVWYGTRVAALTITTVTVEGGETINIEGVEERVERLLGGTYFRLIPRRFAWWYPKEEMLASLHEVDRLKDPRIERVSGTELRVTFSEYEPEALWCDRDESLPCLFLDERGYAFGVAPPLRGGAFLRYHKIGSAPERGVSPFLEEDFKTTTRFAEYLRADEWYVRAIEIDTARDAYYLLTGGGELRTTLTDAPEAVVENLRVVKNSREFSHLKPGNFQYIDLRFGNKVYVNETPLIDPTVATSSATSSESIFEVTEEEAVGE